MSEREREREGVCVCVCVERERERERLDDLSSKSINIYSKRTHSTSKNTFYHVPDRRAAPLRPAAAPAQLLPPASRASFRVRCVYLSYICVLTIHIFYHTYLFLLYIYLIMHMCSYCTHIFVLAACIHHTRVRIIHICSYDRYC